MLLEVHPENPNPRHVSIAIEILKNGGVIVIPTDTVYSFACDIYNNAAIEQLCRIKKVKIEKANFSFLFPDLSNLSEFTKQFSRPVFRMLNATLPGPFTYILPSSNKIPSIFRHKKKTIGIRIPDNKIVSDILKVLGNPLISTSVHDEENELMDYYSYPANICEKYKHEVSLVIDGGPGGLTASTVVDCSEDQPIVIRQGKGNLEDFSF